MQHMVVSCHAETNGKMFKHNRKLTVYYFQFDTLHDGIATKAFQKLKALSPSPNAISAYWESIPESCRPRVIEYPAYTNIPDYKLWNLDKKWELQCGIFEYENFNHKYLLSDTQANADLLSKRIDEETSVLIWLACNA